MVQKVVEGWVRRKWRAVEKRSEGSSLVNRLSVV